MVWPLTRPVASPRLAVLVLLAVAGCAGSVTHVRWDGRRGYDGNGDYGYNLDAPREAASYEAQAQPSYPAPGPPGDPWGPHIAEAARRFGLPEDWIRAVMRQESGGQQFSADGAPVVSSAGGMGLMQVMPGTYELMRRRYGLGPDPFDPRDNILAGAAYLKEMHARFGAPAFLAAYNAGPDRVDAFLARTAELPGETVNYVAAIGPRLGMAGSLGGPVHVGVAARPEDAAFAGGGMTGEEYAALRR